MWRWIAAIGVVVAAVAAWSGHWLVGLAVLALAVWLWWLDTPNRQRRRERDSGFSASLPSFSVSLPSMPSVDIDLD